MRKMALIRSFRASLFAIALLSIGFYGCNGSDSTGDDDDNGALNDDDDKVADDDNDSTDDDDLTDNDDDVKGDDDDDDALTDDDDNDNDGECASDEQCCEIPGGFICLREGCAALGSGSYQCVDGACPDGGIVVIASDISGAQYCYCIGECSVPETPVNICGDEGFSLGIFDDSGNQTCYCIENCNDSDEICDAGTEECCMIARGLYGCLAPGCKEISPSPPQCPRD